jgi:dihydrofolate reductase
MKRKIIMNLAMSIDGFIADENGGFDWITGDGSIKLDTDKKWDYKLFLEGIDTVVMGKACYDQNMQTDFIDKKVFVATRSPIKDYDNIHFIAGDICKIISGEKKKEGKDVFLFGGGILVDNFLKADIVDEFIIGIIPVILGKGRPLFLGNNPKVELELEEYIVDGGIVIVRYKRRTDI